MRRPQCLCLPTTICFLLLLASQVADLFAQDQEVSGRLFTTSEVSPGIYQASTGKKQVIGKLDPGTGKIDDSPMFFNVSHQFVGAIKEFVLDRSPNGSRKIISVVAKDYNPASGVEPLLSGLGVVHLNKAGIVEGSLAKSGWINGSATARFMSPVSHEEIEVTLDEISFWVSEGGQKLWDFRVGRAYRGRAVDIPVKVIISGDIGKQQPVVVLGGQVRLAVKLIALDQMAFELLAE